MTDKLRPPTGLKALDGLAWTIGRDDRAARIRIFARSRNYRPRARKLYREGYVAQAHFEKSQMDADGRAEAQQAKWQTTSPHP